MGLAGAIVASTAVGGSIDDVIGVERVRFRNMGVAEGLSQSSALDIVQDAQGFIWVATQDGLDRYDGYGFRVFKHDRADAWSLAANNLHTLAVDRQGRLWAGTTSAGLSRYDQRLDRFDNFRPDPKRPDALGGEYVSTLTEDSAGTIWVGTRDHGLQRYDEASAGFSDSLCKGRALEHLVDALALDDGTLLLGTTTGTFRCDPAKGSMEEWMTSAGAHLAPRSIRRSPDGDIWMSLTRAGLYRFSSGGVELDHFDGRTTPALPDEDVTDVLVDRSGMVWFGSETAGLSRLDPRLRRLDVFRHAPEQSGSLAGNRAFSLFEDRDGQIWVGTWSSGISVFDPRAAGVVSVHPGAGPGALPGGSVLSVLADDDGTFWFSTAENGGLIHFDLERGLLQRYIHQPSRPDSLSDNFAVATARGPDGSLWIATNGGGLDRMRPGTTTFEHHRNDPADPESLASDRLQRLYFDRQGTLWVGTANDGVDALCASCTAFRHYAHRDADPNSLAAGGVYAILQSRDDSYWIATARGGLALLDPASGQVRHFVSDEHDPASLGANTLTDLHEDAAGGLWIGTRGGGLAHLLDRDTQGARFETIDSRSGLVSDAIGAIAEDTQGRLWLSTTAGISRYDPRVRSVINLGVDQGASPQGYFIASVCRTRDGRIAFGGAAVATIFDPEQMHSPPPPVPVLTGLRLFNTPVLPRWRDPQSPMEQTLWTGGHIVLSHRQGMFSVNYGAPAAFAPESLSFAYRLEPHDTAWIETDANLRIATYTQLSAGDYRLRVRAHYPGQPWNTKEAGIDLTVLPPPWWSFGAWCGYLLLLGCALGIGWLRFRRNQREREAVQETLRVSEERLKLALWGSGAELWDMDLDKRVLRRDNQLTHLAATHEVEDHTFTAYRHFVHPDDIGPFNEAVAEHLRGNTEMFEGSYRTPDAERRGWIWVLTRGRAVQRDRDGRVSRMTGTSTDITALKEAESALRLLNEQLETRVEQRTEALQGANVELRTTLERLTLAQRQLLEAEKLASLGGMVAGIAHEINTPLGIGVTAASHLHEETRRIARLIERDELKRSDLDQFQQTARESSDLILRNLQRADRLVRSFKQVAVDQSNEDRRVVDLGSCFGEILTTLGPTLKKTPHHVELQCPSGLIVKTAPGALYQIVTNLVMNSLTHGFDDARPGTIRIDVSRVERDIVFDYTDDGRGMDVAVRARVFEPFFTTRRGQGGSGLGMHVVYSLVTQLLGGTIDCESAPGKGVRFRVRFNASP